MTTVRGGIRRVSCYLRPRIIAFGAAGGIAVAYFLAARLGVALRSHAGLAFFWPASGIATGALIVFGPTVRFPVALGVALGSVASSLTVGRSSWLAFAFVVPNVVEVLLTAWLVERWFGAAFKLEEVSRVLGFLVASAIAVAIGAACAAIAVLFDEPAVFPLQVWRVWFSAGLLGTVTVAPLLIGLGEAVRDVPPRRELVEGVAALVTLAGLSAFLISMPQGPWATALPVAFVFPLLLWLAVRCRPVFAAAAMFVVTLAIVWSATFNLGHFGDASIPIADRVLAAQTMVLGGTLLALVLAALFWERRQNEATILKSKERLQLALDGAELGAFSADLVTGQLECDARTAQIHGHNVLPVTLKESQCFVHPDDLRRTDDALVEAQRSGGAWHAEYRVLPPPDHPHAGETRWIAVESSIVRNARGTAVRLLGVTRDITLHKRAEQALDERNAQLALAGTGALVGSYGYDVDSGKMQVSAGYAAIHGLPEGTIETTRREWRDRVHPEDVGRLDGLRSQAFGERGRVYNVEYRIVLPDRGVRWIESRSFISYDSDGSAQRVIGVNIDVTNRKRTELALQASEAKFAGILAIAGDAIVSIDANHRITLFNEAAEKVYGYTQAEMLGQLIDLLIPARFRAAHRSQIEHFVSGPDIARSGGERHEVMGLRKNGEEFPAEASISRLEVGGQRYYTVVMRDISDRKRAELALAERNTQLELASKSARVGSFSVDFLTGVVKLTPGCATICGLPEGMREASRDELRKLIHPADLPQLEAQRDQLFLARQREFIAQSRIVRANDGMIRWLEVRGLIFFDPVGRPSHLIGINIDITERKQIEALLEDSEARLVDALAAGQVMAFDWDAVTCLSQRSENAAQVLGSELRGKEFLSHVHADDRKLLKTHVRNLSPDNPSYTLDFRYVCPNRSEVWLEETGKGEFDATGKLVRIKGLTRDITERKRAEERQRVLVAELDHRVKNALATVSAVVSHTRQGSKSIAEFAAAIEGRIRSMAATHELLSSRQWQGLSLTDLVRRELAPYATRNNTEIDGPLVLLRTEAGQAMAMVLHELATNAAKYGALSSKSGRVSVRWDRRLNGHPPHLVFEWQEIGGPPVVAAGKSGYGTSTIRDLIPYEFGGMVDLLFAPEGLRCQLELPGDWLSNDGEPISEPLAHRDDRRATA